MRRCRLFAAIARASVLPLRKRRALLCAFAMTAIATPVVSPAQAPARIPRIGYIALPASTPNTRLAAFKQGMRELGYAEGKNFIVEYRSAEGKYDQYPRLAAELVRLKVDVILADDGTEATLAAKNATSTIPIVFTTVNDPVASGIVASLPRPGGNLTGLTIQSPDTTAKRLQVLKEVIPAAKRVVVLVNPGNSSAKAWLKELPAAARTLKLELTVVEARTSAELDGAFADIARKIPDGLVIFDDALFLAESARIATSATRLKLPAIGGSSLQADNGLLMSYGPNRLDMLRRAASFVDKILRGARPADLPIEQPSKFDLVVNVRTAKALGITIPPTVLLRADKVIE